MEKKRRPGRGTRWRLLYDVRLDQGCASVGYWLAPEARGRGVATHAVRLLARWAFAELGLARLELTCGPDNEASQRVAERCGFVRGSLLRSRITFKGARRDTVIYSLLRGELRQADISYTLSFEPAGAGTRMRWAGQVRPKGAFRLLGPLITWLGIRQEQRIWAGLKEHLEAALAEPAKSTDGQSESLPGQ